MKKEDRKRGGKDQHEESKERKTASERRSEKRSQNNSSAYLHGFEDVIEHFLSDWTDSQRDSSGLPKQLRKNVLFKG